MVRSSSFRLIALLTLLTSATALTQIDSTGIKLIQERRLDEAKAFYEKAVKSNPKDGESHYQLARVLTMQHNFDDAEDAVDNALEINDNDARYHFLRGQILGEEAGNANVFKQAILAPKVKNEFLRAAEIDPNYTEAHVGLYNYYLLAPGIMGGSDEKALAEANTVLRLDNFRGHMLLANYYRRKKDLTKAESEYKKAVDERPNDPRGYKQLGYFYVEQKRAEESLAPFRKYVELDPKNPDAYDSYGDGLFSAERCDDAMANYLKALSIEKNFPPSIFSLAGCYEKKGMKERAKVTYEWYLTVDSNGRRADVARNKIKELQGTN